MNKGELIEKLSAQLGDHKTSSQAVDAVVSEIEKAVSAGEKVNITGFGVFEKRDRAARTARNPRTGEPVKVKKTTVPAFRPGASFKGMVSGNGSSGQSSRAQASHAAPRAQARTQSSRRQSSYAQSNRRQSSYAQASRKQSSYAQPRAGARQASTTARASRGVVK